jgi:hypothetical protein
VEYAELEALDISNIHEPGAEEALAKQVVGFINKNGRPLHVSCDLRLVDAARGAQIDHHHHQASST